MIVNPSLAHLQCCIVYSFCFLFVFSWLSSFYILTPLVSNLFALHIYCRDHVELNYGRNTRPPRQKTCTEARLEVVTATRGGDMGAKCFSKPIPSKGEISDRAARFMLATLQRIILDATSSGPEIYWIEEVVLVIFKPTENFLLPFIFFMQLDIFSGDAQKCPF